MNTYTPPIKELRSLILDALPAETSEHGAQAPVHQLFVPKSHVRALQPNATLVVGSRGAGKSFWWSALQSSDHRALVEAHSPDTRLRRNTLAVPGFGERPLPDAYPNGEVLAALLAGGHSSRQVWKTVMVWAVLDRASLPPAGTWSERVAWTQSNPEAVTRLLHERDQQLQKQDRDLIVLFDALDRSSSHWPTLYGLVQNLLQVVLEFRAYQRIRAKVFLRTDQFNEQRIAGFPDASKLFASKVELSWSTHELYSLLWQLLANHPVKGDDFRELAVQETKGRVRWVQLALPLLWPVPRELEYDADLQMQLFHALTGPYMGNDPRRGVPYRKVPTFLGDAHHQVSPRSFLVALRCAAEDSVRNHPEHVFPVHYKSLSVGVQEASRIRVIEIREDYTWIDEVIRPLKDLLVPCTVEEIEHRWAQDDTLGSLRRKCENGEHRLPPAHLEDGPAGVREDLEMMGVFHRMNDGRVNVPDVYRVGFGLRRRGGVAPTSGNRN